VIAGRHDRLFPLEFMRGLARERLGVDVDAIDSGHLPALAGPTSWPSGSRLMPAEPLPIIGVWERSSGQHAPTG
jgi:hypothetical protein